MDTTPQAADTALMNRYPAHRRESLAGVTKTILLPSLGQRVVIGKVSFAAYMNSASRTVLALPAMQQAVKEWAEQVAQTVDDGTPKLNRGELPPSVKLEINYQANREALRSALCRPPLDDLIAEYDGNYELPDFGMGTDFDVLLEEVQSLWLTTPAELEGAKSVAVAARGQPGSSGRKVRQATK